MKAWKYLVLIGGIAGVAGFFLPFLTFTSPKNELVVSVSAYQIVSGIDAVDELIDGAAPVAIANQDARESLATINSELERYRGALMAVFVPAVALALLGAINGARRKMGRIAGVLAIVLGLANAGIWLLFYQVAIEEPDMSASLGVGLHLLLAAGGLAILAGVGALFAPDRGLFES
jgi:hypothetical protein